MVFSSIPFLYYFLPVAMTLYFLVPAKGRNGVLFLESLVFYAWGDARYVPMLLFDVAQGYACARLICWHRTSSWTEKNRMRWKKCWLAVSVLCALGMLGYYKYADFFLENWNWMTGGNVRLLQLVLPAGISFYTFQIISYTVDVYRGTTAVQRRFVDLAAYICMFPQLIAGPIVRYETIAAQLAGRTCSVDQAAAGVRRLILGLSKKVLLADSLGLLVTTFRQSEKTVLFYWIYAIAFTLQIYFDFSGYSDMAVGMGQMLGFSFPDNFRYPYISKSITEFWRRWHISLGQWFRDYVYIPLGGNRKGRGRQLLAIAVVWLATGLWHGAAWNFVLWGALYALLLLTEKWFTGRLLAKSRLFCHVYVLFFVVVGFVLFDAGSLAEAGESLRAMAGLSGLPLCSSVTLYYGKSYAVLLLAAAVLATPYPMRLLRKIRALPLPEKWGGRKMEDYLSVQLVEIAGFLLLLLVCTAFLVAGSFHPFLYFRF